MSQALQQLINGLTLGAVYGLIAIGYTMVYGIIGMINFAHGDIYMVSAFIAVTCFTLLAGSGVSSVVASIAITLIVSIALTSVFGWTVERVGYRPLRGSNRLAPLISSIGISIFLQNMVQLTQGARVKSIQPLVTGGVNLFSGEQFHGPYVSYVHLHAGDRLRQEHRAAHRREARRRADQRHHRRGQRRHVRAPDLRR